MKHLEIKRLAAIGLICASAQGAELSSPDGLIGVTLSNECGELLYSVTAAGQPVVAPSRLGMRLNGDGENAALKIMKQQTRSADESWTPVVGKRSTVRNRFNELTLTVAVTGQSNRVMNVVFRAYDEGIAFRYVLHPEQKAPKELTILEDRSGINLSPLGPDAQVWSYRQEKRPAGPDHIAAINESRRYPVVVKSSDDRWLAVAEAALSDFDYFDLTFTEGEAPARFTIDECTVSAPFKTPWRAIMISDNP
ncbi:MAG TPA: glycoside hydrolase family 97 N-terminal domain-containing protein, partial [Tichowtungia sp.]|nr:glycoside hydrolase family 97 N-terminal domain-containing protein [Tichowtungia sp.]